jgi:Kef-type K+ transport system membrane component KefB
MTKWSCFSGGNSTYYLVGAFVVGVGAKRFEAILPSIASESMVSSLKNFASFFMPFYFFNAGIGFSSDLLSIKSLLLGAALALTIGFIRIFLICLHRKISLKESLDKSFPISVTLLPNLVFGLVLAGSLERDPSFPTWVVGGLVVYTVIITSIPPLLMFWANKKLKNDSDASVSQQAL